MAAIDTSTSRGGHEPRHYNVHEAKTQLSKILEEVESGEEVFIDRADTPVAKVVPLRRVRRTGRGSLKGQIVMTEDWDSDEVNEEIAHDFGMIP